VSIFLEICILQRKGDKTCNDLSEPINDVYKITINPLKIYKIQKMLEEKLSKMSKNKMKSELQNLKQDNLINYISLQNGKGKRNENYIQGSSQPSHSNVGTSKQLQEAEFRNQVMKTQNKILKEIVTEQSQNILKFKAEYKTLSSKLFIVKSSTKQSQILRKQNSELKTELKEKRETVKSMKKENYYKKLQRREKKQETSI
jgi:predicted RNase H-like nuclease (RuvC/YqgF family)